MDEACDVALEAVTPAPEADAAAPLKAAMNEGTAGAEFDEVECEGEAPGKVPEAAAVSKRGEASFTFLVISRSGGSKGSIPLLKETDVRCSKICGKQRWQVS